MQYVLLFIEGIITFISPCLLPLLPMYVSYFAGGHGERASVAVALRNAVGFVLGFTGVFVALGAFAGFVGQFLQAHRAVVNVVTGLVVVAFGLYYLGLFPAVRLRGMSVRRRIQLVGTAAKPLSFSMAFLFGVIFSVGWTPCISAFLGAALLRASQQGHVGEGMFMLFVFSMGLGVPFIASAVLINRLKNAFDFIKTHQRVINYLAGGLLVAVGILMITGVFDRFVGLFV